MDAGDGGRRLGGVWRPLLVVAAGTAVYSNSFGGVFLFDDEPTIRHYAVSDPLVGWPHYLGATLGRPFALATLAVNYALGGLDPWGYHLVNLLIHLTNALLLLALVARTLRLPGVPDRLRAAAPDLALASALLWVVHPLTTQAVTYVVQRMESLMAMWYLAGLLCLNRAATAGTSRGRGWWSAAAVVAGWLSILSKEVGMTVPAAALLYDRCYLAGSWAGAMRRRGPVYLAMAAGWFHLVPLVLNVAEGLAIDVPAGPGGGGPSMTWLDYARSQPGVVLHYLGLAVWPRPLCFDPRWPVARNPGDFVLQTVAVAGLLAATLWALWRRPRVGFLPAVAVLVLSPSSSFVAIRDLMFEYRMYLPLAPLVVLGVLAADAGLRRVPGRRWVGAVLLAGAVIGLGTLTHRRNEVYRDPVVVWGDVVAQRPGNPRAQYWLGRAVLAAGRPAEAVAPFRAVVEFDSLSDPENAVDGPHLAEAHDGLGQALAGTGDDAGAVGHFRAACSLNPMRAAYARHLFDAEKRLGRDGVK